VDAITHVDAILENGRMTGKQAVDIDDGKCIFCGECMEMCPVSAISLTVNGQPENPVIKYEAFPELAHPQLY
jgi:4Fe-4S ferredoxin